MTNDIINELKELKQWISENIRNGISEASGKVVCKRIEQRIALLEAELPLPTDFTDRRTEALYERLTKEQIIDEDRELNHRFLEEVERDA